MRILDALATVVGRISTGSAMTVSVAAALWNGYSGHIDPVRLGAVITTTIAWLAAEIASGRKPSEHDLALFRRIVENLPEDTTHFLRNQDFGDSFLGGCQAPLFKMASWEGARYHFMDGALQKKWAALHAQLMLFNNVLLLSTGPMGAGPLFTAHPDGGDRDNPEPWVQAIIQDLNTRASKLSEAIDAFELLARSRLKL